MKIIRTMKAAVLASVAVMSVSAAFAENPTFYSDKTMWADGMKALATAASTASGVTIGADQVSPSDKYQAFIQTSMAGDSVPAMFSWWNGKQLEDVVETGIAADLSTNWDRAIANGDFTAAQRDLVSVDGKPYAVLLNVANWVMFFNVAAFEKAGIAAPPATWAELMDACEKLKAAGYAPIDASASGGWMPFIWFSQLMAATNPDAFVGLTDGSVPYDGPEVQEAFKIWGDMYAKGYFADPRDQEMHRYFAEQSAAMVLIGDWAVGGIAEKGMVPGKDFKTFLLPSFSADIPQSLIVEAAPIVVSKAALEAQPDLSKGVDALMTADASVALSAANGVYNGNVRAAAPNDIVKANNEMIAAAKPRNLVRWWEAVPSQIQGDLVALMGSFMLDPTPENATKVMADMQAINADYWASQQ